ncbi:MAG: DMT family transporter [Rhodobacteraceae bacterium]|jgi:drug/metabolite transporter (DMT)-like permease|nr:DMT family transporter [Paracoccaceae bacterium]
MAFQDNLRGSLLMVGAMGAFALEDMFLKSAASELPVGQILILFGAGGMAIFLLLSLRRGERLFHPGIASRALIVRSICEVVGRLCFTLAIVLTPLSSASAILQATPLVVTVGAVVFFGERVGWRRWLAILIGFAGVTLILRPGLSGFEPASLFAVAGTLGFAGRDLATRAAPPGMSNLQLGTYGFAMLIVAGAIALSYTGGAKLPSGAAWASLGAATLIGVLAYNALTGAMRVGDVSVVAPFRYTRLVFALFLGITVFGERPDIWMLVGSAIVIGSGTFTMLRSKPRT